MTKFFISKEGEIYKRRINRNDWILVSPNPSKKYRIVSNEDIRSMDGSKVNNNRGYEELHKAWNDYDPIWVHDGKEYTTVKLGINKLPRHFIDKYHPGGFCLVMHNGELRWADISMHYYPRVCMYKVSDYETPMDGKHFRFENGTFFIDNFGGWTNVNNLKGVKCLTDNKIV